MEQRDLLNNDLLINDTSQANLIAAAKWGRFLAIVGFIFCALMVIGGFYLDSILSRSSYYGAARGTNFVGIAYSIVALILFFPCLFLLKFSNKAHEAVRSSNQGSLDSAFVNLKSLFKFYGIFTIIMLVFMVLGILLGGMSTMMMR